MSKVTDKPKNTSKPANNPKSTTKNTTPTTTPTTTADPVSTAVTSTIPTSATPSAFVAQFPVSSVAFVPTLMPHIGQSTPRGKFATPTAATSANIKAFITALNQYDQSQTPALVAQLNGLMKSLDISAIRLKELPNDAIIFYANPTKGKTTPLVCGGVLTWRFGLTQENGNPATYNNPLPQFFIFDPHPYQDGTQNAITTQFLAGAKALLSHAFNPNVATNPNFRGNPITAGNIKRFSDPSHSNTTAFVPFGNALFATYPKAACTVTHGMVGAKNFQITANNDFNGQFLKNGTRSFTTLLSIAIAIAKLPSGANPSMPINPNIVAIHAPLPGYVIKNNVKVPLSSKNNRNAPIRLGGMIDNTDTVGHMANDTTSVFNRGKQTDNCFLMELGSKTRKNGSHVMQIFAAGQQMATSWMGLYDPTIHDPWQLAKRFPDVYNNMALYPNLYDPAFIKEYKLNGTNPYNTSSSAAAVQDAATALVQMDKDAAIIDPTDAQADDLTDETDTAVNDDTDASADVTVAPDVTAKAASKPLTFSSSASSIGKGNGFDVTPTTTQRKTAKI